MISPDFCLQRSYLHWNYAAHVKFLLLMETACSTCKEIAPPELFHLRIQEAAAELAAFLPPLRRILPYHQSLQQE